MNFHIALFINSTNKLFTIQKEWKFREKKNQVNDLFKQKTGSNQKTSSEKF